MTDFVANDAAKAMPWSVSGERGDAFAGDYWASMTDQ
jgi:hypothetical protein